MRLYHALLCFDLNQVTFKIIYFNVGIGIQQDDQAHSDHARPFPLVAVTEMAE